MRWLLLPVLRRWCADACQRERGRARRNNRTRDSESSAPLQKTENAFYLGIPAYTRAQAMCESSAPGANQKMIETGEVVQVCDGAGGLCCLHAVLGGTIQGVAIFALGPLAGLAHLGSLVGGCYVRPNLREKYNIPGARPSASPPPPRLAARHSSQSVCSACSSQATRAVTAAFTTGAVRAPPARSTKSSPRGSLRKPSAPPFLPRAFTPRVPPISARPSDARRATVPSTVHVRLTAHLSCVRPPRAGGLLVGHPQLCKERHCGTVCVCKEKETFSWEDSCRWLARYFQPAGGNSTQQLTLSRLGSPWLGTIKKRKGGGSTAAVGFLALFCAFSIHLCQFAISERSWSNRSWSTWSGQSVTSHPGPGSSKKRTHDPADQEMIGIGLRAREP